MNKFTLRLLTLPLFLGGLALWAADVWIAKPFTEWTEKDIQKIMGDSPFAKKVIVTMESGRGGGGAAGAPRGRSSGPEGGSSSLDPGIDGAGGGGAGGGGGRGGRGGGGGGNGDAVSSAGGPVGSPETELTIRWLSSPTVQQAMIKAQYGAEAGTSPDAKKRLDAEQKFYVIWVTNLPLSAQPRDEEGKKALLAATTLAAKDAKTPIGAVEVIFPDPAQLKGARVTNANFLFPRTVAFSPDDKEVEFTTKFGKTKVQTKFNLKAMVVNGKLGL